MYRTVAIALLSVAGCGDNVVPLPDAPPPEAPHDIVERSGTRLAIEWWRTEGGQLVFRGIYDDALGEECTIQPFGDAYYCLPQLIGKEPVGYVRMTREVQRVATSVAPTSFVGDDGTVVPDGGFHDTLRDVDCVPTVVAGGVRCVSVSASPSPDDPAMDFAFAPDKDLSVGFYTTADGMRQHVQRFRDPQLGADCTLVPEGATAFCDPGYPVGSVITACLIGNYGFFEGQLQLVVAATPASRVRVGASVDVLGPGMQAPYTCPDGSLCTASSCTTSDVYGYEIIDALEVVTMVPVVDAG